MVQILSAHEALTGWKKNKVPGMYISSILMKNENVPRFEERYGYLDYDWLLAVTKDRKCVETEPVVIKYIAGDNLSYNKEYRLNDFYNNLKIADGRFGAMKRICGTRARYHYVIGETKESRYWFRRSNLSIKNILYYLSSYINPLRKYVINKFRVMA